MALESLDDHVLEVLVEERDFGSDGLELFLRLTASPDNHGECAGANVAHAWVDTANTMVFVLTHIGHVISLLVHVLPVKELLRVERALTGISSPVWSRGIAVEAEVFTLAHAVDELLSNELAHISSCLLL